MTGKAYIDSLMYDLGKIQILTTDTNFRTIALLWANRIIGDIASRHEHWVWLEKTATFPTVASQMSYDLPTDYDTSGRKVLSIRQTETPAKLWFIDQRRFDQLEADPTRTTGNPLYYTLWANAVRLWPVPDDAYTLTMRYLKTITALTDAAGSTTDIPAKFDKVILYGMRSLAAPMYPKFLTQANEAKLYEDGILSMIRDNDSLLDAQQASERHGACEEIAEKYSFDRTGVG